MQLMQMRLNLRSWGVELSTAFTCYICNLCRWGQFIHCSPVIATWYMSGWNSWCSVHVLYVVHYHGNQALHANMEYR